MIRIRNLVFSYGPSFELRVPELDIAAGEKVAIVGRSGCGKTTLLNLISGVQSASSGEIDVAGVRVDQLSDAASRRFRSQYIGFVFQEFELIEYLNVRDNIWLPLTLQAPRARKNDDHERLTQLLEATGLAERVKHFPHQLSQGQRQRAALCRALIHQPQLILADEPTGSLDGQTASEVANLMLDQATQIGATMVVVTHDPTWLERFDRVISLDKEMTRS